MHAFRTFDAFAKSHQMYMKSFLISHIPGNVFCSIAVNEHQKVDAFIQKYEEKSQWMQLSRLVAVFWFLEQIKNTQW